MSARPILLPASLVKRVFQAAARLATSTNVYGFGVPVFVGVRKGWLSVTASDFYVLADWRLAKTPGRWTRALDAELMVQMARALPGRGEVAIQPHKSGNLGVDFVRFPPAMTSCRFSVSKALKSCRRLLDSTAIADPSEESGAVLPYHLSDLAKALAAGKDGVSAAAEADLVQHQPGKPIWRYRLPHTTVLLMSARRSA